MVYRVICTMGLPLALPQVLHTRLPQVVRLLLDRLHPQLCHLQDYLLVHLDHLEDKLEGYLVVLPEGHQVVTLARLFLLHQPLV